MTTKLLPPESLQVLLAGPALPPALFQTATFAEQIFLTALGEQNLISMIQLSKGRLRENSFGQLWSSSSAEAGIALCVLANAIRLLHQKPNFNEFLRDELLVRGKHQSALETLKIAAMFERTRKGAFLSFVRENSPGKKVGSRPDFYVNIEDKKRPVEVKFVRMSEPEKNFRNNSSRVVQKASELVNVTIQNGQFLEVNIVQRSVFIDTIDIVEMENTIRFALEKDFEGLELVVSSQNYLVIVQKRKPNENLLWECQLRFFGPKSRKEDMRLKKHVVEANKQMRGGEPGFCFIAGYNYLHDWRAISEAIQREFSQGRFSSICSVFLHAESAYRYKDNSLGHIATLFEISRQQSISESTPDFLSPFQSFGRIEEYAHNKGYATLYMGGATTSARISEKGAKSGSEIFLSTAPAYLREDLLAKQ